MTSPPMSTAEQIRGTTARRNQVVVLGLVLSGLVVVLYAPVLKLLVLDWWQDPNYGHGFIVPLFSGYVAWRERARWHEVPDDARHVGFLVMLASVGLLIAGTLGAELFISRFSLLMLLSGILLFLAGWSMLRVLAFPLGFLVLMIPLPTIVYNQITFPLQLLASRFAAAFLELVRIPVLREGNLLILPNYTLEVVEACSGIRSLMSLVALAIAYGYLLERRRWVRLALVMLVLPIAVLSNGLRIVVTGLLTYFFGPQSAEGFFHFFSGWLIFLTALLLMVLAHWLLGGKGGTRGEVPNG